MKQLIVGALAASLLFAAPAQAQTAAGFSPEIEASIMQTLPRMITWRRDLHQNPELSYEEVRTARTVAAHLRSLRMEVRGRHSARRPPRPGDRAAC
jgi:amidohydrolase